MFEGFQLDWIDVGNVKLRVRHGGRGPDHAGYSKRAMATDCLALMRALGHDQFAVVGHDRGSYVALRLALDHPEAATRLAFLGAVPIGEALARVLGIWRTWAPDLSGGSFDSGHHMAEENPDQPARALRAFLDVVGSLAWVPCPSEY